MKLWIFLIVFLMGLGIGLSAPSFAPKYLGPYFPKVTKSSKHPVEGTVVRKQADPDRVLLTISAKDGAILATFQKKVPEISLLVEEGDTVALDVRVYAPFVHDPPILRVKKPNVFSSSEPSTPDTDPAEVEPAEGLDEPALLESPVPPPTLP